MLSSLWKPKRKIITNYFHTSHAKRVLISALDRPFRKGLHYRHNNLMEAMEMANVFQELEYQVDVINYDNTSAVDFSRYQVVFGSGEPFERVFRQETTRLPKTILYVCGAYPPLNNRISLARLASVHQRRGVWLPGSSRQGAWWPGIESAVDGLVVLGNQVTAAPFRAVTDKPIHELPLFFLKMLEAEEILKARDLALTRRHFLWFAGSGLVHKGLDLALEAFRNHPELHLHVFGDLDGERPFTQAFQKELHARPNVHVEGFLDLQAPAFRAALLGSAFMLSPSCAEGCNSSVLNICGNGGTIPVLTRACGIDLGDFAVPIEDTTVEAVEAALLEASALPDAELVRRQWAAAAFFQREHSLERYHQRLKAAIQSVLDGGESA